MEEKQLLVHHLHLEEKRGEKMTLQTWFQVFTWKHSLQTFIWITNCSEYIPKNNLHIPLMPILRSQAGRFKDLRKYYLKFNLNLFAILHLSGKNFHVFFNSSCHEWHFIFLKPDLLTRDQSARTFTTTTVWSTKHWTLQPLSASDGPTGGIADVLLLGCAHPGPVVLSILESCSWVRKE